MLLSLHGLYATKVSRNHWVSEKINYYELFEVRRQSDQHIIFDMSLNATLDDWTAAIERYTTHVEWIE